MTIVIWAADTFLVGVPPCRLVYLPADRAELRRRRDERNRRADANALTVTVSALDDFFARFDPPTDDEDVTVYTGEPDTVR